MKINWLSDNHGMYRGYFFAAEFDQEGNKRLTLYLEGMEDGWVYLKSSNNEASSSVQYNVTTWIDTRLGHQQQPSEVKKPTIYTSPAFPGWSYEFSTEYENAVELRYQDGLEEIIYLYRPDEQKHRDALWRIKELWRKNSIHKYRSGSYIINFGNSLEGADWFGASTYKDLEATVPSVVMGGYPTYGEAVSQAKQSIDSMIAFEERRAQAEPTTQKAPEPEAILSEIFLSEHTAQQWANKRAKEGYTLFTFQAYAAPENKQSEYLIVMQHAGGNDA